MKLGFGLVTCQRNPDDPEHRSDAEIYTQAIDLARQCDAAGLASYWVSEHHFVDDGYLPAMTVMLAAAAAVTENIVLGTGVLLAPLWHPLRLAEDLATIDVMSRGRLIVGLGLGWREEEFLGFGAPFRRKVRALEDTVATLRAAWRGETVGAEHVAVTPRPFRAGGPPIWIGGFADPAVERAGRIGDGFFASVSSLDGLRDRVAVLRRSGRDVAVGAHVPVFAWDGPEDPWEMVRDHFWYIRWKYADMAASRSRTGAPPPAPPVDASVEAQLRSAAIVGRPEQVVEQLRAFGEIIGSDGHLVARSYFPGIPWDVQCRQVDLLGQLAKELAHP